MKNIIISTIKYGIVAGAGFLSFAQTSFAAPILTPATVSGITRTSAILVAKVSNAGTNNVSVWFEWGETLSLEKTPVGMRDIYGEGYFQENLSGLREGATYYFRAVAMLGGEKVMSPTSTFKTHGGAEQADGGAKLNVTTPATGQILVTTLYPRRTAPAAKAVEATTKTAEVVVAPAKTTAEPGKTTASPAATNANIAAVIGAGNGVLPSTLIGWLLLFIAILIAVIIIHTIHLQNIQRKKTLEQTKLKMATTVT